MSQTRPAGALTPHDTPQARRRPLPPPAPPAPVLPPGQFIMALLTGLALRCPRCRQGRLYRSALSFQFNRACPSCGAIFERDTGEVTGGMAINMVLTSILGTACAIYLAVFTRLDLVTLAIALTLGFTLFGILFHRHARGLWIGFLYATGAMHERSSRYD